MKKVRRDPLVILKSLILIVYYEKCENANSENANRAHAYSV